MNAFNLENFCASKSFELKEALIGGKNISEINKTDKSKIENAITKSLGVLEHDGVYALFLYLGSKNGKKEFEITNPDTNEKIDLSEKLINNLLNIIEDCDVLSINDSNNKPQNSDDILIKLTSNRNDLHLIKAIFEKTLIYARYHVKALKVSGS